MTGKDASHDRVSGSHHRRRARRIGSRVAARRSRAAGCACPKCAAAARRRRRTRPTGLAELVCSNSFRSDDAESNAVGLLHQEMRTLGSLIMREADRHRVPAGSALAVDRDGFSASVTAALAAHPNIEIVRERVDALPDGPAIIATGPLTAASLADSDRRARPARTRSPSSTRSRRSSTATRSTWRSPGSSRAGTRARARITSTARWTRTSISPSTQALIDGEKTEFKEWERTRPISRAACRSR